MRLIKGRERRKTKRNCSARPSASRRAGSIIEDRLDAALAQAQLSPADRHLCQELVYGIVRWQATLDWLIAPQDAEARPQKPLLQNLLRLGLYQIFWLDRIPDHAAVHETVELARQSGFDPQAGFVNAVLRGYLREFDATQQLLAELKTSQPAPGLLPSGMAGRRAGSSGGAPTAAAAADGME